MVQHQGLFVVLEGIDGSGKSTQLDLIKEHLAKLGYNVETTSEPTSTELGKILRKYLSNPESVPYTDALVFAADRVEHYYEYIKPLVDQGKIVICDRYTDSSVVYQGSMGVPKDWIRVINKMSVEPDLIIFIEISVETALSRLGESERENIEKFENREYLMKIIDNYDEIKHMVKIDGEMDQKQVTLEICKLIESKINKIDQAE